MGVSRRNTQKVTVRTDWHLLSAEERRGLSGLLTETQQRRCPWLADNPGFKRLLRMVSSESPRNLEDVAHILGERGERVQRGNNHARLATSGSAGPGSQL